MSSSVNVENRLSEHADPSSATSRPGAVLPGHCPAGAWY